MSSIDIYMRESYYDEKPILLSANADKSLFYPNYDYVILVDHNDDIIGYCEKLYAHSHGLLHRAFSIVVWRQINKKYYILIQKRNKEKYHSGGLWTNACCSHPRPEENIIEAAKRRIKEELGLATNNINEVGSFTYQAKVSENLIENELDYVLSVNCDDDCKIINFCPKEIEAIEWVQLETLMQAIKKNPGDYTPWLSRVLNIWQESINE